MSASELISNLQAAIQSQEAAEQAFEDWEFEYNRNETALALALERRPILLAEKAKREHDLSEGRKDAAKANEAWWQFCRVAVRPEQAAPLPASPPAPGAPKKGGRKPYSPEQKVAAAARSAQKKATRQRLIAEGNAEAIAEQAKIDERVAKMQAGLKAWKAGQKMPEQEGSGSELEEVAHA